MSALLRRVCGAASETTEGLEGALFDLDGTLVVTEHVTDACVRDLLQARGQPGAGLPLAELAGRTWRGIAGDVVARFLPDADPAEVAEALASDFDQRALAELRPVPGAAEFIGGLLAEGVSVAVVTSSTRRFMAAALARLGLDQRLDLDRCVGQEDVSRGKPDPEAYALGASRLGLAATRCVAFEDSRSGALSARAAGCRVVGVTCAAPEAAWLRGFADAHIVDYADYADYASLAG